MVAAFDYCLHGRGGAAPSIDTAMHGLVDAAHVDHLHPDAGIAIATAADGEALTRDMLRRPGGLGAVAAAGVPARARHRRHPARPPAGDRRHPRRPRHHGLGRHVGRVRGATRWRSSGPRSGTSPSTAAPSRSARDLPEFAPLPATSAARGRPSSSHCSAGLASTDRPQVGHFTDSDVVLDFLARSKHPRARRPRDLVPGPLPANQGATDGPRPGTGGSARGGRRIGCGSCMTPTGEDYRRLLRAPRDRRTARRCAAPTRRSCSCPASACSASARTGRPPGSPASSTSTPST